VPAAPAACLVLANDPPAIGPPIAPTRASRRTATPAATSQPKKSARN
jgi:hypothetical protein